MSSTDLISFGSLIVAVIAFVVSYFTYHVQKRTQASSDEQNLNDLIEKIQAGLATVGQPQTTFKLETFAAENTALAALQGQALEARKLAKSADIELDWFQNMVLAYAFTQTWDPASAKDFWDGAVTGAKTPQARIRSLTARAEFYYNRGLNDDWLQARADYQTALEELRSDPDGQGPDLVAQQAAGMEVYQAGFEFNAGNDPKAVSLVADAFIDANAISARWRKLAALDRLGSLVQAMQQQVIPPREVLVAVAAELSRRGDNPGTFPPKTAALLSMPPDGSQPSGLYGADS